MYTFRFPQRPKKGIRSPEAGVREDWEQPNIGVGNEIPVLYKNSKCSAMPYLLYDTNRINRSASIPH